MFHPRPPRETNSNSGHSRESQSQGTHTSWGSVAYLGEFQMKLANTAWNRLLPAFPDWWDSTIHTQPHRFNVHQLNWLVNHFSDNDHKTLCGPGSPCTQRYRQILSGHDAAAKNISFSTLQHQAIWKDEREGDPESADGNAGDPNILLCSLAFSQH